MSQQIYTHVFDNGLTLLAEPIASLESAAFTLLLPAGFVYDRPDRVGVANFTCEMMLRGCGSRDSRAFVNDLDNLGVERGESCAASHMSFSGATRAANLMPTLSIYADLVRRPHLPGDQLEAGRAVVLQELQAIEDDPAHKVMVDLRRRHYGDPWGRPSAGEEATLESADIDELKAYFAQHSRPNGAILAVAGRVDWDATVREVGKLFGDWKPTDVPPPADVVHKRASHHEHHESNQTQIGVAYRSVPYNHPQYFQAWGAVGALSGGMSCRLFTEIRERRGLCYSVYASHHTLLDRGSVLCYAGTSAERAQETLDVLVAELKRLSAGIEPAELDRLKARVKSGLIMQQESSSARSGSIAREHYLLGRVRTLDELSQLVDAVTCASINEYLAANPPRDFVVATLGGAPLELPDGVS
ncbi:MAG: insulinase family protein [Planctomycetota bacterium]|nr:MAG: insulinase family protein [Planctomycetota bacterium]